MTDVLRGSQPDSAERERAGRQDGAQRKTKWARARETRRTDDAGEVALDLLLAAFGALRQAREERDGAALREAADDDAARVEVERVLGDERLERVGRRDQALAVLVRRVGELLERRQVEPALQDGEKRGCQSG